MEHKQHETHGSETSFATTVLDLYVQQGLPINHVCEKTGESYAKVREVLEKHQVPVRGRGTYTLRGADHPSSKLCQTDREQLEIELLAGKSHGPLAETYGISRERVRQIAEAIGAPTGRQLQLLRRAEKQAVKDAKKAEREKAKSQTMYERYAKWRELWGDGKTIPEMADELGLKPGSVSVRIVNLRKRNPGWFPLRRNLTA